MPAALHPSPPASDKSRLPVADAVLVRDAQHGNIEAFDELVRRHQERIYATVYHMTSSHEDADDLTQESFIKAYRALKSFKGDSSFFTWLYRIAYRQALDQYRRRRRRDEVPIEHLPAGVESSTPRGQIADSIADREAAERLRAAIDALPIKLRTAVVLRYFEGCTFDEICEITGCARGVLQKRLAQAHAALRDALGSNGTPA